MAVVATGTQSPLTIRIVKRLERRILGRPPGEAADVEGKDSQPDGLGMPKVESPGARR
jgi:hypothetical protein